MTEAFARRYRLLERIAIGGTAEVFAALFVGEHGTGQKPVVVKRVLPQLARDERFRRLFFEEACLAATLSHPNVVKVLDYGDLGDTCFIAMERIDGQDLESLLAAARSDNPARPIAPALAALIAADVGDALQFIHRHTSSEGLPLQIVHRDVSPHNILVSYQGDVKLTDFGIAKSVIRREHTIDGTLRGKLEYMAPEQALLDRAIDHRADLFALGCVLYEMLQGHPPLRGSSEIDTLQRVRDVQLDHPPEHLDAPAPLRAVLARLLRADPTERYAHASELVAPLRAYLRTCPAPHASDDLAQWARRLRPGTQGASQPQSAADAAVAALLGDSPAETPNAPIQIAGGPGRALSTSIFALQSGETPIEGDLEASPARPLDRPNPSAPTRPGAAAPTNRRRSPPWVVVSLTLFGLLGWGLWGLRLAQEERTEPQGQPDAASNGGSAKTARPGTHPATATTDARGIRRSQPDSPPHGAGSSSKQERASQRPDPGHGYLTVNSLPWSRVYLDGHYVGNTPLIGHEVRTGLHRVELKGPEGGLRKSFRANVRRESTDRFTFDFRPPTEQRETP